MFFEHQQSLNNPCRNHLIHVQALTHAQFDTKSWILCTSYLDTGQVEKYNTAVNLQHWYYKQ